MSNELVSKEVYGDVAAYDPAALEAVSQSKGFLPRLQLFGANSGLVKEGKIGMGHYGLVKTKDSVVDLGKEVEVAVLAGRAKAMRWDGENVITNYDQNADEFKKIVIESETPDSGCMYGPEFLTWVPSAESFATFFMSNPTSRRVAPDMIRLVQKAAILTATLIKTKRYSWHGPVIAPCTTPTWTMPGADDLRVQISTFLTPKSSEVESVETQGRAR